MRLPRSKNPRNPLTVRESMEALGERAAAARAEQEALWDEIFGSDRALAPNATLDTFDGQEHPCDDFDAWDQPAL
jgi:hypothetical protein